MVNQILLCLLEFGFVGRVGREAVFFERYHEGIADAVLHQDLAFISRIPEIGPFGRNRKSFFFDELRIIKNTDGSPGVWHGIFVFRVELLGHFHVLRVNVFDIWNIVKVEFGKQVIFLHFLNHVVGWADYIVVDAAGFDDRIHFFQCLKYVVGNLDSGFLFKFLNQVWINIFACIVDVQFV